MINWSKGILVVALITNAVSVFAVDNTLTQQERDNGWELLFDGHDMAQWRNYKQKTINKKWIVEEGKMVLTTKGAGDLISRKKYKNFELSIDWNIALAGNSGIFILVDEDLPIIFLRAPEIQLLDNERHHDNEEADHLSGSLYDMIASPVSSHRIAGQWNTLKIKILNKKLTVWQNDFVTAKVIIGSKKWSSLLANSKFSGWKGFGENEEGHIGIQDHGDKVALKNIKIRVLD